MLAWLSLLSVEVAPSSPPDEGFFPVMLFVTLCVAVVCLVFVGIGIAIGFVCAAAAAALVGLGILSSSALVAIWQRRFSAGWRALHYQVCAALGVPGGVGLLCLGSHLFALDFSARRVLLVGALAGTVGGLGLGAALDGFGRFAGRHLRRMFPLSRSASHTA